MKDQTCYNCGRSRVETHTGDSKLVCWKDKSYGRPVAPNETCPVWVDPAIEPMGEYAEALLRRVRDLEDELGEAQSQLAEMSDVYDGLLEENRLAIAGVVEALRSAFTLARELFLLVPAEEMPVEYAVRLNEVAGELVDLGVGVD